MNLILKILQVGPSTQHDSLPLSLVALEPPGHKHLAHLINSSCIHTEVVQKGRNNRDRRHTIWSHHQGLEANNHAILTSSCQRCSVPHRALGVQCCWNDGGLITRISSGINRATLEHTSAVDRALVAYRNILGNSFLPFKKKFKKNRPPLR